MSHEAPPLRADANRNRGAIIGAASTVFASSGLNVTLESIARTAGVGVGTIYRRFPTIEDLVGVVFDDKMSRFADRAEQAAEDARTRPWDAFSEYVHFVLEEQADDFAFSDVLLSASRCTALFPAQAERGSRASHLLVERAKSAGVLRPDFVHADLELLMNANAGIIRTSPEASRRFADYMLKAFRAPDAG